MDPRAIDPTTCWVRHVRRGVSGDPSAIALARVYYVRDDVVSGRDGLNGRQGWQNADVTLALSDDGTFTITLPNAAGDDGVLHRRRFRILTDDNYEPGEEWLEFWSDADAPDRPFFVGTPTDYAKTKSTVTLKGRDLGAVLDGAFSSDVDVWDAAAPADVFRHYARLPVLIYGADSGLADVTGAAGAWSAAHPVTLTGAAGDCWEAAVGLRWTSPAPAAAGAGRVSLTIGGVNVEVDVSNGVATITGPLERTLAGKKIGLPIPGPVGLRIVARYEHIFVFVAGELVADYRRAAPYAAPTSIDWAAYGGTAATDSVHVESLAPFAARGASAVIDRVLPGIPPATGLREQLWNVAPIYGQNATTDGRLARLWSLLAGDPDVDRIEPTLALTGTPPRVPGAYAARWSGAVYLDLATSDREIRVSGLVGNARLYIGRTLRGDEGAASWYGAAPGTGATTITVAALRAWLGSSVAGWYPIVVEQAHATNAFGITLEDRVAGGAWATVPTSRLSPIGVYTDLVRLESHRSVIVDVAQTFGYQWRVEHRSVESGEFPGQITAAALIGRQTNLAIDDVDVGTDAEVQGNATDVVDALLVDGAGIADPAGSGQLTVRTVDYPRAAGHLALRASYESLSEISEPPLLATRADSLLALRSSPNEQVGVRPRGQRDLVDAFPLTGVLARMDWRPGDAARLALDSVDVVDTSPRQMTSVAWSPRPDGLGVPTVGFRQRPRTVRAAMRRLTRAIYGPQRNYQGSIAIISGALGGSGGGSVDAYSRVPMPANADDVVKVIAVVQYLTTPDFRLEVNGTDLGATDGAVKTVGRYDVTRAAGYAGPSNQANLFCRLIGGTGSYQVSLEVWVRV